MATKYTLTTAFTAITETTGTIQNVGDESVELASTTNAVEGEGIVLKPGEKQSFKGTLSARSLGDAGAAVNVVDFTEAAEGGDGGGSSYVLPVASASTLGGVKVGQGLTIVNGVLSTDGGGYTLPTASSTTLGGIKVGDRLSIADGVLSADEYSAMTKSEAEAGTATSAKVISASVLADAIAKGVSNAIDELVNSAPASLDTLKELADALGNDANFAATVTQQLAGKLGKDETAKNAEKVNNLTVETAVPANAVFTDTTYENASTTEAGLMSAADKTKLNGIEAGANNYTLPTASASTLGGVKVGQGLTITDGVLTANGDGYTLPTASATVLGGVKVGQGLTITDGVLTANGDGYTLPAATDSTLGGVKIGNSFTINDGVLSIKKAGKTILGAVKSSDDEGKVTVNSDATMTVNPVGLRQPSTEYAAGAIAYHSSLPTGYFLLCTTPGTTDSADISPTASQGTIVTDGTAEWTVMSVAAINGLQSSMSTAQTNISSLQTSMTTAQGNITTLQGNMATAQTDITNLQSAMARTYKAKGSIAFANLPATLTSSMLGWVYNIYDDFTTDARFVEGAGNEYFAGENVAVVEYETGVYRLDVLSGYIDLSDYPHVVSFDSSTGTLTLSTL